MMEAINKNKEEIEKILKGCKNCGYICHKCNAKLSKELMGKRCPNCQEWTYNIIEFKGLCPICKKEAQATIKTSILWCEDEIKFLENIICGLDIDTGYYDDCNERIEQLQTHLNWLKEQEKNNGSNNA